MLSGRHPSLTDHQQRFLFHFLVHHDITVTDERHVTVSDFRLSLKRPSGARRVLDVAQVEFGDVRRAEGAQVQTPIVLVNLADVGRH